MKLSELASAKGAVKSKRRVGRGLGSGCGKTCSRGQDGQNSRSGGSKGNGFEGGQMPITQKMPKRGFNNKFKKSYDIINIETLNRFEDNTTIDPALLFKSKLVGKRNKIKILGEGELKKRLIIKAHKFSRVAQEKLKKSGGNFEVIK